MALMPSIVGSCVPYTSHLGLYKGHTILQGRRSTAYAFLRHRFRPSGRTFPLALIALRKYLETRMPPHLELMGSGAERAQFFSRKICDSRGACTCERNVMMSLMKDKQRNGKKQRREEPDEISLGRRVSSEVLRGVSAIFCIALGGFLVLASADLGGVVGSYLYEWLSWLLGVGYMLLPLSLILLSIAIFRSFERSFGTIQLGSMFVFLLAALGLVNLAASGKGGVLGSAVAKPIVAAVDVPATIIFLVTFIIAALTIAFNVHLGAIFSALRAWIQTSANSAEEGSASEEVPVVGLPEEDNEPPPAEEVAASVERDESGEKERGKGAIAGITNFLQKSEPTDGFPIIAATASTYTPPPVAILAKNRGKPEAGDVQANMNIIKRTLQNFGIVVEMDEASIGPTVTRYAMKPAEGVRLSKIVALQSNLELALAASPVRIEAPIPGKSLVGIEVPNIART